MSERAPASSPAGIDQIVARLSPQAYYQSPGGRRTLMALTLISGLPQGSRVLDVQCGIGSATVDLAEAFGCTGVGFDDYAPYLAFAKQQAASRQVGSRTEFRALSGAEAVDAFELESFDAVLGLGGGLSDTLPGGLQGGLSSAHGWLRRGGLLFLGDLVCPGEPSEVMRIVFGDALLSEAAYLRLIDEMGFTTVFAMRSAAPDWDDMEQTIRTLQERALDLGPEDERRRADLTRAARDHPELAYLNVVARKR